MSTETTAIDPEVLAVAKEQLREEFTRELKLTQDQILEEAQRLVNVQIEDRRTQLDDFTSALSSQAGIFKTLFSDVAKFHRKFDIPVQDVPSFCNKDAMTFRANFIQEEFDEFKESIETKDLPEAFDALIDIIWIALGTADMMGLTEEEFNRLWDDVVRANMSKVRASGKGDSRSKRKSALDIVKPKNWESAKSKEITEDIIANRKK